MKHVKKSVFILIAALSGCAEIHYSPRLVPPMSVGPKEKVIGTAAGEGESLLAGINNAIGKTGADTMVNVFIDQEESCTNTWGVLSCMPMNNVRIFGTLIKYVDDKSK